MNEYEVLSTEQCDEEMQFLPFEPSAPPANPDRPATLPTTPILTPGVEVEEKGEGEDSRASAPKLKLVKRRAPEVLLTAAWLPDS